MSKILNPYLENLHSYNGKLHEAYTTSIYNIVYDTFQEEDFSNMLGGYVEPNKIIERAREIVFDFDYPIEINSIENEYLGTINLKETFEKAFIMKYLTDEIAYESFTLWKTKLMGKIFETVNTLNLKFNTLKNIKAKDLYGGYEYSEHIENTHNDTDKNTGNTTDENTGTQENTSNGVGSAFPVNSIDAFNDLGDVDYADSGSIAKGKRTDNLKHKRTDNLTHENNGGYTTDRDITKTDDKLIENLLKLKRSLDNYITEYVSQFNYLFLGIL